MASRVYSVALAHLEALPGGALCFTVPPGHVYVVKQIDWFQSQVAAAAVIRLSEDVANLFWYADGMPVTRWSGKREETTEVFEPGMKVSAWADTATTIVRLSGYDLLLP